jgi:hypothetical protein
MPARFKVPVTNNGLSLGTLFFPDERTIQGDLVTSQGSSAGVC